MCLSANASTHHLASVVYQHKAVLCQHSINLYQLLSTQNLGVSLPCINPQCQLKLMKSS